MNAWNEASFYHDSRAAGFVAVAQGIGPRGFTQQVYPVADLPAVLEGLNPRLDTWISQASFSERKRRSCYLQSLRCLYVDLDVHKSEHYSHLGAEAATQELLRFCEHEGVLQPSLVNYSGRGLQAKWLVDQPFVHDEEATVRTLHSGLERRLADFGADPQAKDCARVLRVLGTVNTRSGEIVQNIYGGDRPVIYDREIIAVELEAPAAEQAWGDLGDGDDQEGPGGPRREGNQSGLRRVSPADLAADRFDDLVTLLSLRGWDLAGVPQGSRDTVLKFAAVFLAGYLSKGRLRTEIDRFAAEFIPSFTQEEVASKVGTILERFREDHNPLTDPVVFNQRMRPHLYWYQNSTIIEELGITPWEEERLRTLIGQAEAAERHRRRNRKEPQRDRATYLAERAEIRQRVLNLREVGWNAPQIAQALDMTPAAVRKLLSRARKGNCT